MSENKFKALIDWCERHTDPESDWYVKRLSDNDTQKSRTHQAGVHISKASLFQVFPELNQPELNNPDIWFDYFIDSHIKSDILEQKPPRARAVWYNNKFRGGTRNECRITNWGGRDSPLLNPDNSGAICVFIFLPNIESTAIECHIWVCRNQKEETWVEEHIGLTDTSRKMTSILKREIIQEHIGPPRKGHPKCWLKQEEIPPGWLDAYPSGAVMMRKSVELLPHQNKPSRRLKPSQRLLERTLCEETLFYSIERAVELPSIIKGFNNMKDFEEFAKSLFQRRRARAGRSLELHVREILAEEGFIEGSDFEYQKKSDDGKRPDFIFPSERAYRNQAVPNKYLRMLATKTTCKDRWRQVINEADRIRNKHLLTLQTGITVNQFLEMSCANIHLVVPKPLIEHYPKDIQAQLLTIEDFIQEIVDLRQHWNKYYPR